MDHPCIYVVLLQGFLVVMNRIICTRVSQSKRNYTKARTANVDLEYQIFMDVSYAESFLVCDDSDNDEPKVHVLCLSRQ